MLIFVGTKVREAYINKCKDLEIIINELNIDRENLKAEIEYYKKIINQLPILEQNSSILQAKVFSIHRNISIHRNNSNHEPTS